MKNLINKTQQKIYAIWRKAKQHISSFVGGQFKKRQTLTKIIKKMAEFLHKTKEEIEKVSTHRVLGGAFITIGLGFIAIYPLFAEKELIKQTYENTFLFFGSIFWMVILGLMLIKYPERLARREDFYDKEEKVLKENLTKDIKDIISISNKDNRNLEDIITGVVLDKYEKEIDRIKIIYFNKPLHERNSYLWFLFDIICDNKIIPFLIGIGMFAKLIYNVI